MRGTYLLDCDFVQERLEGGPAYFHDEVGVDHEHSPQSVRVVVGEDGHEFLGLTDVDILALGTLEVEDHEVLVHVVGHSADGLFNGEDAVLLHPLDTHLLRNVVPNSHIH